MSIECPRKKHAIPTITSHARLAGNTSGDDNNLSAFEGLGQT